MNQQKPLPLDWRNILLLLTVHLLAVGGLAIYLPWHGMTWAAAAIGLTLSGLTIFSISAGYHRLFSHRTFEAHPILRLFLLAFGAGAFQNSAIAWAADHRRHHARTDTDLDPYSATRGWWHSHIGWVLRKADPNIKPTPVRDLERDPLVVWQRRHYALIGAATGVALPVLLGFVLGDPWGGFVVGAAARLVVTYHATFAINSFAHLLGAQPYSDKSSARDSLLTALISMGEGYHNFHHAFPGDYRNGFRAYQYDPTKWILRALAATGLAKNLRRTPQPAVVRAQWRMDARRFTPAQLPPTARERLDQFQAAVDQVFDRWHAIVVQYEAIKRDATAQARQLMRAMRADLRVVRRELSTARAAWLRALHSPRLAADADLQR
jgi:stearoyl-CoA desaturase (Delta-9 desaturase)